MSSSFLIDRRSEQEIATQIEAYCADASHPASRTLISASNKNHVSYPLVMSLNRVVRFLAAKTNLLDEKYFRFISDKVGLYALPPDQAVAPVTFKLTKGHDEVFVPKGTKLTAEKDDQVSFETSEDLIVRNNSLKSVTIEDHSLSKSWTLAADNGELSKKLLFSDPALGNNIVYRQMFSIKEKVSRESLQFLQFTNLELSGGVGVAYSFDKFTELFSFLVNGTEVIPVHFDDLFVSQDQRDLVADMEIDGDLLNNTENIYLPIRLEDAAEFSVEIASYANLKEAGVESVQFGSVRFFQFSAPTAVVVDEAKVVIGADSKHFSVNAGTENFIYIGSTEALATEESLFKVAVDLKLYWEGLHRVSQTFRTHEISSSSVGGIETFFNVSRLEYYDGVFWVPITRLDADELQPTYDETNKKLVWNIQFDVPKISLAKVGGTEARWIRLTVANSSGALADSLFDANDDEYQAIAPWARITNILLKKVVGDSDLRKTFKIGDFGPERALAYGKAEALTVLSDRMDIFFELDTFCENRKVDWYFFVDPHNKDFIKELEMKWDQLVENDWAGVQVTDDRTLGLVKSGKILINAGKNIYFNPARGSYVLRLQLSPKPSGQKPSMADIQSLVINGVYNNTVDVNGIETDTEPRYFSGSGEPHQTVDVAATNILGFTLRITEPTIHSEESGLQLASNTKAFDWQRVENFYESGPQDRHFVLDHRSGKIQFGDGVKGKAPAKGSKNIAVIGLRKLSSGVDGIGVGEINKMAKKIPGIKECRNIYRATGFRLASDEDEFYSLAPQKFKHSNRPVTFSDFEQITLEAFSEVYSCRTFFDTTINKVKVVVVPRNIEDLHSNDSLLSKIDEYLIRYCVSNRVKASYPTLVPLSITITTRSLGDEKDLIVESVKKRLRLFFDTVQGGQDQLGWQVGRNVYKSEISWALNDILGTHLHKIEFPNNSLSANSYIQMEANEYPDLTDIVLVEA